MIERMENALLQFVERASQENATDREVDVLPAVASALTALVSKYRPIGFYCASSRCGMNKHGVFVCRCGKCHPLSEE